jgi:DNA invertase Pin-like site-specific DNA recombinase
MLGVSDDRVYLDHGLTGRNRARPGLEQALAAVREATRSSLRSSTGSPGSVPDARAIGDSLAARGVRLSLGGTVYDPNDPIGKCFFNILATFAEFEVDLLRMRTREGMAIARANGKLKGKQPKLNARQRAAAVHQATAFAETKEVRKPRLPSIPPSEIRKYRPDTKACLSPSDGRTPRIRRQRGAPCRRPGRGRVPRLRSPAIS